MNKYNSNTKKRSQPDLKAALTALQSYHGKANANIYYGLSGLATADLGQLKPVWEALTEGARAEILVALIELSETNFELDYRTLAIFNLDDEDRQVRKTAIELLWEDQTLEVMRRLIEMAEEDETVMVRAAAASALGRYILMGELEQLPEHETVVAQDAVVKLWSDANEDVAVRRRALEAISNCEHKIVPDAITEAYESGEQELRIGAIFAMGRSYDKRWRPILLREIQSSDPELCYEAVRACGELEMAEAVPYLARLTAGSDREIKEVAIWSLGEIGGMEAMRVLERLADQTEQNEDEDLQEAIEDALANANMMSGDFPSFADFEDDEDEDDPYDGRAN